MPDNAQPEIVAVGLLCLVAIWRLLGRRSRPRSGPRRPGAPAPGRARCAAHRDKVIFRTEREAREFVSWTQQRYAAGRWRGKPMDHSYRCPLVGARHWHVSSKPQRRP